MTSPGNTVDWTSLRKSADDATKPAPPGDYVVEIKKADSDVAKTSGMPKYVVRGTIVDGPSAGKTIFTNINVTLDSAFAMSIFFRNMEAFGLGADYFASGPSHEQVCADLVGRRAVWTLDIREYQGTQRNDVKSMAPVGGPMAQSPVRAGIPTPGAVNGAMSAPPTPSTPQVPAAPSIPSPPVSAPPRTPFDS